MKVLITGASGFIGFHLCRKLMQQNCQVIGIDNFNSYYDPLLKEERYNQLQKISRNNFEMHRNNIEDHTTKKEFMLRWTKKMSDN